MSTLSRIYHSRGFQKEPFSFTGRALSWGWAKFVGRQTVDAESSKYGFTMRLPVGKAGRGSRGFFLTRDYYEPFLEILDCIVKPGDVFFDCGANQGIFSLAAAKLVGDTGKVFSFEPQPYATRCLKDNLVLNNLDNVTVTEVAVSDQAGSVMLDVSRSNVAASIVNDFGGTDTLNVETVKLDDVADEQARAHLDVVRERAAGGGREAPCGYRPWGAKAHVLQQLGHGGDRDRAHDGLPRHGPQRDRRSPSRLSWPLVHGDECDGALRMAATCDTGRGYQARDVTQHVSMPVQAAVRRHLCRQVHRRPRRGDLHDDQRPPRCLHR